MEFDCEGNLLTAPTREEIAALIKRQRERSLTLVKESPEEVERRGLTPVRM